LKKILTILSLFLFVGCTKDLNNTPTKRVEVFLSNYQSLSEEVQANIISDVEEMPNLNDEEKNEYVELWKRHYQGLTYEIKDEKVDGDDAIVTAEIEVYDYSQTIATTNEVLANHPELFQDEMGNHSYIKYNDYRLEELKKANDKVKYTIDFKVKKIDKKWILQEISDEDSLKMSGMYNY